MSLSTYQRILAVLEQADGPLSSREIAARDSRLGWRQVGLIIHHNGKPGEISVIKQGDVKRYRLTREVMA